MKKRSKPKKAAAKYLKQIKKFKKRPDLSTREAVIEFMHEVGRENELNYAGTDQDDFPIYKRINNFEFEEPSIKNFDQINR